MLTPNLSIPLVANANDLNGLMGPGIALMRRMRINTKFALITFLFVVPLVFSAAVFERRVGAEVQRTELQLAGLRFCQELLTFVAAVQDRRAATDAVLNGDPDAPMQVQELDAILAEEMRNMQSVEAADDASTLGLQEEWATTASGLQALQNSTGAVETQTNYEAHTALLTGARKLMQAALDRSYLALDQDVAVANAVQAGFHHSQLLAESLAAMRTLAISALQRKTLTNEELTLLRGATERVRIYHAELGTTLERLFETTPELRAAMTESLEGAEQAIRFSSVVEKTVLNTSTITMSSGPVASLGTKATKSVQQVSNTVVEHIESLLSVRYSTLQRTRLMLITASGILVLIACYLLIAFIRTVHLDLRQVGKRLDDIASGELTGHSIISGRDEFAELLRGVDAAQDRLLTLIREVQSSALNVDQAAQQIASENAELSARSNRMVSSLETASHSVLDLARSVNDGSARVSTLDDMAKNSSLLATEAALRVDQVVERIQAISTSSRRIEEIIAVVDGITFQTRLLSLNAAVEAARAGEHGRGFSVVATEVRQLAARSQQASSEIGLLVRNSLHEVESGTSLAADAHAQMLKVVEAARKLSLLIGDVTQVANEQGETAVRITPLLEEVQADSGHNARRVEQVSEATTALDEMVRELRESMSRFRIEAKAA